MKAIKYEEILKNEDTNKRKQKNQYRNLSCPLVYMQGKNLGCIGIGTIPVPGTRYARLKKKEFSYAI